MCYIACTLGDYVLYMMNMYASANDGFMYALLESLFALSDIIDEQNFPVILKCSILEFFFPCLFVSSLTLEVSCINSVWIGDYVIYLTGQSERVVTQTLI